MAQFDIEAFRDYMLGVLQAGMTAKVDSINAEKGDTNLDSFDVEQYLSSFNDTVMNFERFVYYKITEIKTIDSHAGGIARRVSMMFIACVSEPNDWSLAEKKILRYSRAMEEIFLSAAKAESRISDFEIEVFEPDMVQLSENSPWMQAGGVQISGVITT